MNSDENVYIEADLEKNRLISNFKSIHNLYDIIWHLDSKYMSKETANDFYKLILDRVLGRSTPCAVEVSHIEKRALNELFDKSQGLITHFKKGEKERILDELKRLDAFNYD